MPEKTPSALGLALTFLRSARGWSKKELAQALGMGDRSLLSHYERGDELTREKAESLLAPLALPPEAVEVLLFAHGLIFPEASGDAASPTALSPEERRRIDRAALGGGWTAAEVLREELIRRKKRQKAAAAEQEAEELWALLKTATPQDRRDLVETFPGFWTCALAARVCEESRRAAAHRAKKARELAELALLIAERLAGEESLRCRTCGYCWGHLSNARRVGNDFDGADEAFARAWELWDSGAAADCELLPEWRLLSLEASLRRAQHRFAAALDLLERARTAIEDDPPAVARILLQKEHVFDVMGDSKGALAALEEAAPFVESSGDPDLLFSLRFNLAADLCSLERYGEAATLLPHVRELAVEQANELDLIRVVWLDARIAAGQGRSDAAIAGLEQVRRDFADHELPYDAALASLDLAMLWLRGGRTAEVKELALEMESIFIAKKIHREALVALQLFWEAAKQETASLDLVQSVIAKIERVRRSASPGERPR
jgi:transcriptional regulator with XRE-family HTH domain